ncbi:MAG: hypothetical protein KC613_17200 [Myxococcales bacterium]|nr:hypothetical protein [Myxococcales bacterium]
MHRLIISAAALALITWGCDDDDPTAVDATVDMAQGGAGGAGATGGEGGQGGEGGMGGQGGEAGMGGNGEATCEVQCGRLADCAVSDACPGYGDPQRAALLDGCLATCEGTPALAVAVAAMATCADIVTFAGQSSGDFYASCNPLPCQDAQDRIVECMTNGEICPNLGEGDQEGVRVWLESNGLTCPDAVGDLNLRGNRPTCAQVVEATTGGTAASRICQGINPSDACTAAADRLAECAIAQCPALEPHRAGMVRVHAFDCVAVSEGRSLNYPGPLTPEQVAALINAETPCEDPHIQAQLNDLFRPTALLYDGIMVDFCAGTPARDPAACAADCERLQTCSYPGGRTLFYPDACQIQCEAVTANAPIWACLAEADACGEVVSCGLQSPMREPTPAPEGLCDVVGQRLSECYLARCPAMAPAADLANHYFGQLCEGQIALAPGVTAEAVQAAITAETACDDLNVAAFIELLTFDSLPVYDGLLAATCDAGPVVDAPTCAAACAAAAGCDWASDTPGCEFACATNAAYQDAWACLLTQDEPLDCDAAQICFQ